MTYILLIIIYNGPGVTSQQITFKYQKECVAIANNLEDKTLTGPSVITKCIGVSK